jgi:hypothetical protein
MNLKRFAMLVDKMRGAQRVYFRDRSPRNLSAAKNLEATVDETLRAILRQERSLFDALDEQENTQGEPFDETASGNPRDE